jgi:hypothetical protein
MLYRSLVNDTTLTLSYVPGGGSSHNRFAVATNTTATVVTRTLNNPPSSTVGMTLMRVR